jgi:hypothetical protein
VRRSTALLALTAVGAIVGSTLIASPASARPWPGHPGRSIVNHIVRPGDTATGLAVRYHAWTDELIALHHGSSLLVVGEKVRIPVVIAAARRAAGKAHTKRHATHHVVRHHAKTRHHAKPRHHTRHRTHLTKHEKAMRARGWRHWRMSRTQVRHLVARKAHQRGFDGRLAQAVAWQESGWRQPVRSSAGAIGVMQVMPDTGKWMSQVRHRYLNLRNTYDNVDAGVSLLHLLRHETSAPMQAVAAYYQGLGALREHGWYGETHRYVRSVLAIRRTLARTGHPVH